MRAVMEAADFKQLINNAKRFLGNSKMFQYIYLKFDGNTVTATALDGHRVSRETASIRELDEGFTCYIKPNIPKITQHDRFAELELIDGRLLVTVGDNITGYVQPEGEYFNVDELIGKEKAKEVNASIFVDPKLLKEALESCAVYATYKEPVKLEISGKRDCIKIWYGRRGEKNNLKLVLPVSVSE